MSKPTTEPTSTTAAAPSPPPGGEATEKPYTLVYDKGGRLSEETWLLVEKGKLNDHNRAVNAALMHHLHQLNGRATDSKDDGDSHYVTIGDPLYAVLLAHAGDGSAGDGSAGESRAAAGPEKPSKKRPAISKKDQMRIDASRGRIGEIGQEFAIAARQGPAALKRFLHSPIYEVRGAALMWYAQRLAAGGSATAANELDVVIQKFLEPSKGKSYTDPTRRVDPSPEMVAGLNGCLSRMRARHPFDGVQLAVDCPSIIWSTQYDACLPETPIRARANQRETLQALHNFLALGGPFALVNLAPPGAGKSSIIVAVAAMITGPGAPPDEELYVCAGQGRSGSVQLMRSIYGGGTPFSTVFIEKGELEIVRQHGNRGGVCRVFVGTADAILRLLQSPKRRGVVVIDEPTYGADIAGSEASRDIMRILAGLAPANRRVMLLGATFPSARELPTLLGHFGRHLYVAGGEDSIQIACDVRTTGGRAVLPHTGCTTAAEINGVIIQMKAKPFIARIYKVSVLVLMCDALRDALRGAPQGPDLIPRLRHDFDSAANLKPNRVVRAAIRLLEFLAAQDEAVIAAVCRAAPPDAPPVVYRELGTCGACGKQTMIVDTDPLGFALEHFEPLLAAMRAAGVPTAEELYAKYNKSLEAVAGAAAAAAARKKKGSSKGGEGQDDNGDDDRGGAPGDTPPAVQLGFPDWAQIGTGPHRARFRYGEAASEARTCWPSSGIPECAVSDAVQLLLLARVGILSSHAVQCPKYQAEVWNLASRDKLAYLITDHTGCYGANLLLDAVCITERFAGVASLATIEQAGGRLCRVGLTYKGTLILPESAADRLLAAVRLGDAAPVCTEAANMETAFIAALTGAPACALAGAPARAPVSAPARAPVRAQAGALKGLPERAPARRPY
jgi:hypothetical protein